MYLVNSRKFSINIYYCNFEIFTYNRVYFNIKHCSNYIGFLVSNGKRRVNNLDISIRKLNTDDVDSFYNIENKVDSQIIIEELKEDRTDTTESYEAYGIFNNENVMVGCCGLSNTEDYSSCGCWDNNSKAVVELCINDNYKQYLETYYKLLEYILNDKSNEECNIFFIDEDKLPENLYKQLGFTSLLDGTLVRLAKEEDNNISTNNY